MNNTISRYIAKYNLSPHPEGGFYNQVYKSPEVLNREPSNPEGIRSCGTMIYYLLESEDFSAWHRLNSDEIWQYCDGSSLTIRIISPEGDLWSMRVGNSAINPESEFFILVKANHWFCASVDEPDSFTFVTCKVCPGFDFKDFELGDEKELIQTYPQHTDIIPRFIRKGKNNAHPKTKGFMSAIQEKKNRFDREAKHFPDFPNL